MKDLSSLGTQPFCSLPNNGKKTGCMCLKKFWNTAKLSGKPWWGERTCITYTYAFSASPLCCPVYALVEGGERVFYLMFILLPGGLDNRNWINPAESGK